jgi:AcrR family transcriptional regulator
MAEAKTVRRSQTERRDEAEQRLFSAAVALIAEHGLERLTLAEVGMAAGYSRGLPAHYFGSKAGLIVTLAERLVEDFGRALERVERHELGLARLLGTVRFYLDSAMREPVGAQALYVLLSEAVSNPLIRDQIARLNARSARAFEVNLVAAIQAGEVRADIDAAAQATLILGALRGAVSLWLLSPDGVDLSRARDALVASLERSLAA